ncbi:hypothetical protein C5B91_02200 [Haloferax sp. Atlit-10N]|uniref:hypothetical protein n=1 Tax=Haloferax TaxID=2251 RepID=UPI0006790371|nr:MULTISPECIES: hypothetical protein [Haloferax]RDZ43599.1 hypothetical protein C5B86_11185 [Haloferax sp. Atlit-19N]RDZ46503.1 hypothetical protein C5B87_02200 [Haloferax sp. Atlit-16N]RDZ60336.1 hypothetical protein C5B91_02200 [Haloferax sp. Atlit-10N]
MSIDTKSHSSNDAPDAAADSSTTFGQARLYAFYLLAVVTLGMAAVFISELLSFAIVGWGAGGDVLAEHRLHLMVIAANVWIIILGVASQLYRPLKRVALMQVAFAVTTLVLVGTIVGGGPVEEVVPFFVLTGLMGLFHPAGRDVISVGDDYSPALLGLVAVAALPVLAFAVNQFGLQATGDIHAVAGHYMEMTTMAIGLLLLGLVAAAGAPGHRFVAWLTGGLAVYFGAVSLVFPTQVSSVGTMWAVALVVWGLAFVVASELRVSGRTAVAQERPFSMPGQPRV